MLRRLALIAAAGTLLFAAGCAKKPAAAPTTETTAAKVNSNVRLSDELMRRCNIHFNNSLSAPKFDFDESDLLAEDRHILEQIAKCVTTGPLKGRRLALVGRADPRGEIEYNMILGEYRAENVRDYLAHLGVANENISETSRGELDAMGSDEDSWRLNRRVDIILQ